MITKMYIVIECGEPYPVAYATYEEATKAVVERHIEQLKVEWADLAEGGSMVSDVDIPENVETGKTMLYVEKGYNIYIHRVSCPCQTP